MPLTHCESRGCRGLFSEDPPNGAVAPVAFLRSGGEAPGECLVGWGKLRMPTEFSLIVQPTLQHAHSTLHRAGEGRSRRETCTDCAETRRTSC